MCLLPVIIPGMNGDGKWFSRASSQASLSDCKIFTLINIHRSRPDFSNRNYEWIDDNALDYYDTFAHAKAAFLSAVRDGRVTRFQKIVTQERLLLHDDYIGSTTDGEFICSSLRVLC